MENVSLIPPWQSLRLCCSVTPFECLFSEPAQSAYILSALGGSNVIKLKLGLKGVLFDPFS